MGIGSSCPFSVVALRPSQMFVLFFVSFLPNACCECPKEIVVSNASFIVPVCVLLHFFCPTERPHRNVCTQTLTFFYIAWGRGERRELTTLNPSKGEPNISRFPLFRPYIFCFSLCEFEMPGPSKLWRRKEAPTLRSPTLRGQSIARDCVLSRWLCPG